MQLVSRLNLLIFVIMALMIAMGTAFTIGKSRESVTREITSSMRLASASIDTQLTHQSSLIKHSSQPSQLLNSLVHTRHISVVLLPQNGQSSQHYVTRRPDVPKWFLEWVKPKQITQQHNIELQGNTIQLRLISNPADEIEEAWRESKGLLSMIVLQSLIVALFMRILIGKGLRQLSLIVEGITDIEQKHYGNYLPKIDNREIDSIAQEFNHAMDALEESRLQNQRLKVHSLNMREQESQSLSREVHDELGQSLTGIKLLTTALQRRLNAGHPTEVTNIIHICDHLFSVVRDMMRRLRPIVLDELGLIAALEELVAYWQRQYIHIHIELTTEPVLDGYNGASAIQLYRITQEALSNSFRHSQASEIKITLKIIDTTSQPLIELTAADNGIGFKSDQTNEGFGLKGIRERIDALNGQLVLESRPHHGTKLCISIPMLA